MYKHTSPDIEKYPGEYYSKNLTGLRDLKLKESYTTVPISYSPPVPAKYSGVVMVSSPSVVSRHDDRYAP